MSKNKIKGNKLPSGLDLNSGSSEEFKVKEPKNHSFSFRAGASLLSIFVVLLIVFMLFRKFTGHYDVPTFRSFLEMLTTVDPPTIPFNSFTFSAITADWSIFNFLRDFLNIFVDVFNVILFLINGMVSLVYYVWYFIRWLFLSVLWGLEGARLRALQNHEIRRAPLS